MTTQNTGCCPPFDPTPWQEQKIVWEGKMFVKDHVTSFFHVPLNMGAKIRKNMERIEQADAVPPQQLMLSDEKSPWGADVYINVTKPVPNATMAELSGTFLTKVFEGPYRNAPQWAQEMQKYVEDKGEKMKKLYFSYTTCPRCAKAYGKNYVILFAQI